MEREEKYRCKRSSHELMTTVATAGDAFILILLFFTFEILMTTDSKGNEEIFPQLNDKKIFLFLGSFF